MLPLAGMPADAFLLIFDGTADNIQPIVDVMKVDSAWQDALESYYRRESITRVTSSRKNFIASHRRLPVYIFDGFHQKLAGMLAGNSVRPFFGGLARAAEHR